MAQEKSKSADTNAEPSTGTGKSEGRSSGSSARKDTPPPLKAPESSGESAKKVTAEAVPVVPVRNNEKAAEASPSKNEQERSVPRRRPAGPARSRIAANDDVPTIGGLIFALQQRPSRRPFVIAGITSAVWAVLGSFLSWTVFAEEYANVQSFTGALLTPASLTIFATILLPIALSWFLALLAWRSQELRLVSSAMTEVAVRLAEPDRMAEQSIASLGQTVRRQVAAMNDAISRALGRAGELEALVHNEVAALERSYTDNELRIRRLIEELANERAMLNNNSDRMGDAIRGIGNQVAREIHVASEQATQALTSATETLSQNFAVKGEKVTSAMRAAGTAIDERLTQQGTKLTEQLVHQGTKAAQVLYQAGEQVNSSLRASTEETTALITSKGNTLLNSVTHLNEKVGRELPMLLERLGGEQSRLSGIIGDAVNNLAVLENALTHQTGKIEHTLTTRTGHLENVLTHHLRGVDKSLADRTQMLDAAIGQRTRAIDASLSERAKAFDSALQQKAQMIDNALVNRTKAIDAAFSQHVGELDSSISRQTEIITRALIGRSEAIQATLAEQAKLLDDTFLKGVEAIRVTTKNLSSQSVGTVEALASQADVLKSVSEGLLKKVGLLTQKFENQGQAVMSAAQLFESSQTKMDSVLENRRSELNGLLHNISSKAVELDGMMQSYSGKLEHSLSEAQSRAHELSKRIASDSQEQSQQALAELEMMRNQTKQQAESTIADLRDRFSAVSRQISSQMGNLSSMFTDTTKNLQESAKSASAELEETQADLRNRINQLPEDTRNSAKAMRQALSDQLRAIDELNAIARKHSATRDITPPLQNPQMPRGLNAPGSTQQAPGSQPRAQQAPQQTGRPSPAEIAARQKQAEIAKQQQAMSQQAGQPRPQAPGMGGGRPPVDLDAITASIAQSVGQQGVPNNAPPPGAQPAPQNGGADLPRFVEEAGNAGSDSTGWLKGVLGRADDDALFEEQDTSFPTTTEGLPTSRQQPQQQAAPATPPGAVGAPGAVPVPPSRPPQVGAQMGVGAGGPPPQVSALNINSIAQAVHPHRAEEVWMRYQGGERGLFSRELYTPEGQLTFDDIQRRLTANNDFRLSVNRYLDDFERMLTDADQKDPSGQLITNHLNSKTGRAYLLLSHASGRMS